MPAPSIAVKQFDYPVSESCPFRVPEVVSPLTFALDLSAGQPIGHSVRSCVVGMRLAKEVGLPQRSQSDLYYALLLKDAGWSSWASPPVRTHGREFLQFGLPPVPKSFFDRVHVLVEAPAGQNTPDRELAKIRSGGGASVARRMGLPEGTASAIRSQDERWNGEGGPDGLHGEEIPLPARIIQLAQTLDMLYTAAGQTQALDSARQRSGIWFDPDLVRAAESLAARGALWTDVAAANWRVIELEPREKPLRASEAAIDNICRAFGEAIDARSPFTHRHSMGVAGTAVFIARMLGMPESDIQVLQRAALLHDIGKLGISSALLEKPGKLTGDEWTVMRKHPYYTYEILKRVPGFGQVSEIAASHHEKLDGSGYFRGLKGEQLSLSCRILVIADVYDALSTKRSYRDALPQDQVFEIMRKEAPHALDATCLEALMRSADSVVDSNAAGLAQLSANVQNS